MEAHLLQVVQHDDGATRRRQLSHPIKETGLPFLRDALAGIGFKSVLGPVFPRRDVFLSATGGNIPCWQCEMPRDGEVFWQTRNSTSCRASSAVSRFVSSLEM
jgi:hypothetical protein